MTTLNDSIPQLEQMRMGVAYSGQIRVRGFVLNVRVLSIAEHNQIRNEVIQALTDLPESTRTSLMESSLLAKHTLYYASTSDVGANDHKISHLILDRMSPEELQALYKQWVLLTERANPSMDVIPVDELNRLIAECKKNPSTLMELTTLEMISVCRKLISDASHTDS